MRRYWLEIYNDCLEDEGEPEKIVSDIGISEEADAEIFWIIYNFIEDSTESWEEFNKNFSEILNHYIDLDTFKELQSASELWYKEYKEVLAAREREGMKKNNEV